MPDFDLYIVVKDAKGEKSTVNFPAFVADISDVGAAINALADLIDPLINGGIVAAGARIEVALDTVTTIADLVADVQEGARFVWSTVDGFLKSVRLPTFLESLFLPNSKLVDQSDTDVFAFTSAITEGIDITSYGGTGLCTFRTVHREDLTDFQSAAEDWGRNRA